MLDTAPKAFLDISERLNRNIRELAAALAQGQPAPALVQRCRAEAQGDLDRLRALGPQGSGAGAGKVAAHLDLFVSLADSLPGSPVLSRKLLDHLLEEQLEITSDAAAAAGARAPPPAPAPARPAATEIGGGRSPLTVGSLIGR